MVRLRKLSLGFQGEKMIENKQRHMVDYDNCGSEQEGKAHISEGEECDKVFCS